MVSRQNAVERMLINGRIYVVDDAFSIVEALALRGGRIVASGSNQDIQDLAVFGDGCGRLVPQATDAG